MRVTMSLALLALAASSASADFAQCGTAGLLCDDKYTTCDTATDTARCAPFDIDSTGVAGCTAACTGPGEVCTYDDTTFKCAPAVAIVCDNTGTACSNPEFTCAAVDGHLGFTCLKRECATSCGAHQYCSADDKCVERKCPVNGGVPSVDACDAAGEVCTSTSDRTQETPDNACTPAVCTADCDQACYYQRAEKTAVCKCGQNAENAIAACAAPLSCFASATAVNDTVPAGMCVCGTVDADANKSAYKVCGKDASCTLPAKEGDKEEGPAVCTCSPNYKPVDEEAAVFDCVADSAAQHIVPAFAGIVALVAMVL